MFSASTGEIKCIYAVGFVSKRVPYVNMLEINDAEEKMSYSKQRYMYIDIWKKTMEFYNALEAGCTVSIEGSVELK